MNQNDVNLIIFIAVYMLPSLIAILRRNENTGPVMAINLFTGWTGIGWLVAFIHAVSGQAKDRS